MQTPPTARSTVGPRAARLAGAAPLLLATLGGCVPLYFAPAPLVPQVARQGELELGGALGIGGAHAQGAYGVADDVGVAGQVQWGGASNSDGKARFGYAEAAGYYVVPFARVLRLDGMLGLGAGFASGRSLRDSSTYEDWVNEGAATYVRPFAQLSLALVTPAFDLGIAPRFSLLRFAYNRVNGETSDRVDSNGMFEPTAFLRFGWTPLKLGVYAGLSLPTGQDPVVPPFFPFTMGITLSYFASAQPESTP